MTPTDWPTNETKIAEFCNAAVVMLRANGCASLLDALGFDGSTWDPYLPSPDIYGAWSGSLTSQDRASKLVIGADFGSYENAKQPDDEVGDSEFLLVTIDFVLGLDAGSTPQAMERSEAAWRADGRTPMDDWPNAARTDKAELVLLSQEAHKNVSDRGVWVSLRGKPVRAASLRSPTDLIAGAAQFVERTSAELQRSVYLVRGAIYGKPPKLIDTVTGWAGECAVLAKHPQLRWPQSWLASYDFLGPGSDEVVEVKATCSTGGGRVHLSPSEVAEAVRRRDRYRLVEVRVPEEPIKAVVKLLTSLPRKGAGSAARPHTNEMLRLGQATGIGAGVQHVAGKIAPHLHAIKQHAHLGHMVVGPLEWLVAGDRARGQELAARDVGLEWAFRSGP